VTLAVAEGTAPGTYPVTVTGTGAGVSVSDDAELRVVPAGTLTVTADPTEVSVAQGEQAGTAITVQRVGVNGNVRLGATGLPPGARARFDPRVLRPGQDTSQLTIRVGRNTPPGSYPVTVTARSGNVTGSTVVTLEVVASGLPFTISGDLGEDLYPDRTVPLNLTLDNPNGQPLRVRGLYVTIDHLDAAGVCPVADNFAVTQFSGDYGDLVIPAEGSVSLDGLGIPDTAWPQVTMIETGTNQNGCMGAELSLHYTGTAIGG
jgi:PKD repeat protein